MIVEFIGTPGSGKTTFMPVVRDHFNQLGYQAYPILDAARPFAARTLPGKAAVITAPGRIQRFLLWQIFYLYSYAYRRRFFRQNPALIQELMDFQKQRPISENDRKHVLHWFVHLTGSYEFLKAYALPGDLLIFDEGFVHRVVQLFASEKENPDLDRVASYLDLIPAPDVVIFPKASSEVCEKRVYERGVWERFRDKEWAETRSFIQNAHLVVNFAVQHIYKRGWTVIEVDNDSENLSDSRLALKSNLSGLLVRMPEKVYLKQ